MACRLSGPGYVAAEGGKNHGLSVLLTSLIYENLYRHFFHNVMFACIIQASVERYLFHRKVPSGAVKVLSKFVNPNDYTESSNRRLEDSNKLHRFYSSSQ